MTRPGGVCVFCERTDVALELVSLARTLADEGGVISIVAAPEGDSVAREHIAHGADTAVVACAPAGADTVHVALEALRRTLIRHRPDVVLIGATARGAEIASRLAQGLLAGCASECTGVEWRDGRLLVERACLGRFVATQAIETRPAIATVQPRRFEPLPRDERRTGAVERLEIEPAAPRVRVVETRPRTRSLVRMDKAEVVVGIGRGLRSRVDLKMIEELARALGGVVGASRPLTDDLQWLPPDRKIGLSGATVKPKLYIACGISGQIEHNVGMRESGVVVAINSDPAAPIMKQADFCITGDLHEIVPALIEALARVGGRADG